MLQHSHYIMKISKKRFVDKYNWKGINYSFEKNDWKKIGEK